VVIQTTIANYPSTEQANDVTNVKINNEGIELKEFYKSLYFVPKPILEYSLKSAYLLASIEH